MNFKSNKGYSLVEIGVGIIILTVFLLVSIGLFNGAYTNYRRIKQKNGAINFAVLQIESMLQSDANELTGFFVQELDTTTNRYVLKPSGVFKDHVQAKFNPDDVEKYISDHTDECINSFIQDNLSSATEEDLESGDYGFIVNGEYSNNCVVDIYNGVIQPPTDDTEYVISNSQPLRVVRTIKRLSAEDGKAYGNEVLKLRVEVFYSHKFGSNISKEDMESIVLETIKVTTNTDN